MNTYFKITFLLVSALLLFVVPTPTFAQEDTEGEDGETPEISASIRVSGGEDVFVEKPVTFELEDITLPEDASVEEILWDFGDGVRTTGESVTHAYRRPGDFTARVDFITSAGRIESNVSIRVFEYVAVLLTDSSAPEDQIEVKKEAAAEEGVLLVVLRSRGGGTDVVTEEQLATLLIDARDTISKADIIMSWTSGSVGASALSKLAQHIRQTDEISFADLSIATKGVIMLSDTPLAVLAPSAQAVFDQLEPSYVLLTRPQTIDVLLEPLTAEEAKEAVFASPFTHRLLGPFSGRAVRDLGITNFMSVGISFLVNRGVPLGNITLVLMLPVIASILSFSRQVIGIKAFGIITPAMTTISFLVMGLQYGLIVFAAVIVTGTLARVVMRRLRLLYLPRMALVLTIVSLAILALFGLGAYTENNPLLSFSIFPILILTLLAEEFIAVQFQSGAKKAMQITLWTIGLSIACYFIVSWQLLRTIIISYPEVILLAIPLNILLGRWGGLRLTEYLRFRKLLRYTSS